MLYLKSMRNDIVSFEKYLTRENSPGGGAVQNIAMESLEPINTNDFIDVDGMGWVAVRHRHRHAWVVLRTVALPYPPHRQGLF